MLSKRVFAFSVPPGHGIDLITLNLILLQRQSCLRRKKKKRKGCWTQIQGGRKGTGDREQSARSSLNQLQTPAPPGPCPPPPAAVHLGRERERWWDVVSHGGKQTGCWARCGPFPQLPGMTITGPLLAAPRAIKAEELREPSA